MEIKPFSMQVNPEQSRIVQEFLFANGYRWRISGKQVMYTERSYLTLGVHDNDSMYLMHGLSPSRESPLITFEQFKTLYMKSTELKITSEKVLSAANKCPQAKEVLKEMFPEVFEENKSITVNDSTIKQHFCVRNYGEFAYKSYYLSSSFNWEVKKDMEGLLCLIPTEKD